MTVASRWLHAILQQALNTVYGSNGVSGFTSLKYLISNCKVFFQYKLNPNKCVHMTEFLSRARTHNIKFILIFCFDVSCGRSCSTWYSTTLECHRAHLVKHHNHRNKLMRKFQLLVLIYSSRIPCPIIIFHSTPQGALNKHLLHC